ncbi:RHS repeat domain-containing protein [Lysobacter fragariae]
MAYDGLDRVIRVEQDSELSSTPLVTRTEYLPGFQTRVTNPRGFATTTTYQAYDQPSTDWPVAITHPEGAYTDIARDLLGKPTALKRHNIDNTIALTRSYGYDAYQRLYRTVEPETGTTFTGYDTAGNPAWSAAGLPAGAAYDPDGNTAEILARKATRTFDARNRVTSLVFPDGRGDQSWTYTPDGLPAQITTYNGSNQTQPVINAYHYNHRRMLDGQGESVSQTGWYTWGIGYGYTTSGNLAVHTYPDNLTVDYQPNALGQPTQVGTFATGVSYHPNGAIAQFTYGNGIVHTLTQNMRGLPEKSCDAFGACGSAAVLNDSYDFDQNGNVAAISDGVGIAQRGNRTMTYDGLDRLKTAVSPMFGTTGASYSYDVLDNLTRVTVGGTAARDQYYCYDSIGTGATWRLTNVKTGSCSGASVIGLGYDVQGNLANKNGQGFNFDYGNRLRAATSLETYRYDGLGRRVLAYSVQGLGNILSQYSQGGQLMYQYDQRQGKYLAFLSLGGSLVAIREKLVAGGAVTVKYQHTDALGSPVAVTDAGRNVIERSEFEPYGQLLNRPLHDGPGYAGHVSDKATGLSYMQQRYYDPGIGRFLSVDPVTADGGTGANFNRYWYANDNPYKFKDPDGRYVCKGSDGNCGNFEKGLALVRSAAVNLKLSSAERDAMRKVVDFYGKKGDASVSVSFRDSGLVQGTATLRKDGGEDVTLVAGKTLQEHGRDIVHEGTHGVDDQERKRSIETRAERKQTEINAYTAQAYFQKAENFATSSRDGWTPLGGFSPENIDRQAENSIKISCGQTATGSCGQ